MVQQKPSDPTSQVTRVPRAVQAHALPEVGPPPQMPADGGKPQASLPAPPPLPALHLPQFEQEMKCDKVVCSLSSVVPTREFTHAAHAKAAPNAALWVYQIQENSTVVFPENHAVELYALVLKGSLAVSSPQAETATLEEWSVAQAEGAGISLSAATASTVAIAVVSKAGPLDAAIAESNRLSRHHRGRATMRVVELRELPVVAWGNNRFSARLAFGGEATLPSVASFGILGADAQGAIPTNVHATEWEHLVVLSGEGSISLGQSSYPVRPGSVIQIEPGLTHSFSPSGTQPLLAVQLFSAKGPELRYLELSRGAPSGRK
ncbi:MAG: cupin domain-containing protein [Polyangiaceae bacterium]|nr:cupin domain-containing protein [Polyangiaceae bacterium]